VIESHSSDVGSAVLAPLVVGGFNPAIDTLAEVDAIDIGGVTRLRGVHREAGGKGLHVAVACAMLGAPATLVGPIDAGNRDLFAQTLADVGRHDEDPRFAAGGGDPITSNRAGSWSGRRAAADCGVRFVGVPIDQPIRTCWAIRDREGRVTELLEPGPPVSPERAAMLVAGFMREAAAARFIVLSGSLPTGMPADTYARLIGALDPARILLDTSGEPLAASLSAEPLVVKPNRQEASQIAGFAIQTRDDAMRAAARIAARGPRIVILSLGADGAIVYERDGTAMVVEAPRVDVRNTVGAGDCLLGAFAVALRRGDALEDCARFAVACGTAKAAHPDIGLFDRADVDRLLPQVRVTRASVHA
jgi:1-phosphofructokinase family hexose kinase